MKMILMILVSVSLSMAKMTDIYVIITGSSYNQLKNNLNNMQCRWKPVGGPLFVDGIWLQAIMCKNLNEKSNRYLRRHCTKDTTK